MVYLYRQSNKKGGHLVAVYIDGMGFDLIEAKWLSITELPEKPRKLKWINKQIQARFWYSDIIFNTQCDWFVCFAQSKSQGVVTEEQSFNLWILG